MHTRTQKLPTDFGVKMAILFMQNDTSHFSLHFHLVLLHSSEVLGSEKERAKSFLSALQ